jgi:ArsR family transcriptional regulator, arsenate/arsenite/antimonite-responsive transcriptional repressor
LAHHLRTLVLAGLVVQERRGRETYNRPDFDVMAATTAFLTDECCAGVGQKADGA